MVRSFDKLRMNVADHERRKLWRSSFEASVRPALDRLTTSGEMRAQFEQHRAQLLDAEPRDFVAHVHREIVRLIVDREFDVACVPDHKRNRRTHGEFAVAATEHFRKHDFAATTHFDPRTT
jgi:hypothetical protein